MNNLETQKLDRPTRKIGEHLQDALVHLENVEGLSVADKEKFNELLNEAFGIVKAARS